MSTFVGLLLGDELQVERGGFEQLADWEPVLRYLHAGICPTIRPGPTWRGSDWRAPCRWTPRTRSSPPSWRVMGYLHVKGVFSDGGDGRGRPRGRPVGVARPARGRSDVVGDGRRRHPRPSVASSIPRSVHRSAGRLGGRSRGSGASARCSTRNAGHRARTGSKASPVLIKVPGQDQRPVQHSLAPGLRHGRSRRLLPRRQPSGIQLTGSNAATGHLRVVPGSHGQALQYGWQDRSDDVPVVSIDTSPGDVTVHIQDVMHASPRADR